MTTSNNLPGEHPQDLLALYALDALEDREEAAVEAHVDRCPACRNEAAMFLEAAAGLGAAAAAIAPPAHLRTRLLGAVGPQAPEQAAPVSSEIPRAPLDLFRWLQPSRAWAPALVILLAVSIAFNFYFFGTNSQLHENEAILAARLLQMSHEDTQLLGLLSDAGMTSYLTENTSHQPVKLSAPGNGGDPKGVMVLADDSRKCVLLISNMQGHGPSTSFHVWLSRPDQRVRMGEISVDSKGWGMMNLFHPYESMLEFEKVYLSLPGASMEEEESNGMVLEGSIAALRAGQ